MMARMLSSITSIGEHVTEMMLQDFDGYQALFEIELKKKPSFMDQQDTHQLQ